MRNYKLVCVLGVLSLLFSCKKVIQENENLDRVVYEVDGGKVYLTNAEKTTPKSSLQLMSVLYSQMYKKAIPVTELMEMENLAQSIGDKQMFYEVLMANFINDPEAELWTSSFMLANPNQFVEELFLTFLNRKPDAYEQKEMVNRVISGNNITDFYWGVLLSNEYQYY